MVGLEPVRVLEIGAGVGVAWAAKLFADLGADVLRLEAADDVVRNRPFEVHRWLNTSKRATLLPEPAALQELAAEADVVLHGMTTEQARATGLDYDELSTTAPGLVVCAITPWGSVGPYANYRAEELNIIHGSSWGFLSPAGARTLDLPPLKAPGHHAVINMSTLAASVALAAYRRAARTGVGEHIDFSLVAAAAKTTEWAPVRALYLHQNSSRIGSKASSPWGIYQCRDGLIQAFCAEEVQWRALVTLMGEPDWANLEIVATTRDRQINRDLVDLYLGEWFADKARDDVYHAGQKAGVCLTPVYQIGDLAQDPYFKEREFFGWTPDGTQLPGAPFHIDQPWWQLRNNAPEPGTQTNMWRESVTACTARSPATDRTAGRPLEGVRVCDFTWVWAGPYCTQMLAHLGAEVIRVESPSRPDFFRRTPLHPPGVEPSLETSGVYQVYNSDKRSISIDLNHPDARAIILDVVRQCDIVIDNFSVGTMARFGLGAKDLRAVNPSVIVASLSGYGQTGSRSNYMGYGPVGGAIAGQFTANGYTKDDVLEPAIAVGDPSMGLGALWAVVASLAARDLGEQPTVVDVSMTEATAATMGELWMEFLTTGSSPSPRANHDPQWAPHNCYATAGEDRWITIACTTESEWAALCSVVDPALRTDRRFATPTDRKRNEQALDDEIGRWTAHRDAWDITEQLQRRGVPAFPSVSPLDLWINNPQFESMGMLDVVTHPITGTRPIPGIPWRLRNGPNGIVRPAPLLGQHTDEVLAELLSLSAAELADLRSRKVLPPLPATS